MLWTFNYKDGPAPLQGMVEARDEATAYRVMTTWGKGKGIRVFGQPRPMILADESILGEENQAVEKQPATFGEKLKTAVGIG